MRFASIGGSNASNYAAAGKAVADSAVQSFATQRKSGPDYGKISQVAMKTQANEKIAAMKAEAEVTAQGLRTYGQVKKTVIQEQGKAGVRDVKAKSRKAGLLGAVGTVIGAGYLASRDNTKGRTRPKADLQGLFDKYKADKAALKTKHDAELDGLGSAPTTDTGSGGNSPGKDSTGSTRGASGTNLSGEMFDMSKLTKQDYDDLAFAVSSEAQLGTDDEYGVAANILTRLKSGKYGNSVHSIIHAPGQYEGVYKGLSVASPEISSRFQTPEGMAKIQSFMQQLNGRTEFKGQSMLHNRVKNEDPMFSPGGNFYHYAGQ